MTYKNPNIKALIDEISEKYGITAYRNITRKNSLDDVEGTILWYLWYANKDADILSVSNMFSFMDGHHEICEEDFHSMLVKLRDALEEEFNKLKENS